MIGYLVAFVSVAVAIGLKIPFKALGVDHPFLLLPAAVIVSTWVGGRGPGILATILCAVGADLLFLPPLGIGTSASEIAALVVLVAEGVLIVAVTAGLRDAHAHAQGEASELDRARRAATLALEMREELLRLWTAKLAGPLAHTLVAAQRARESVRSGDVAGAESSLGALEADLALLQRTAETLRERGE